MERRNFVKGILGLTGIAASGASVAIEPKKTAKSKKGITVDFPTYTEANQSLMQNYEGSNAQKGVEDSGRRMAERMESDFAKFILNNSRG